MSQTQVQVRERAYSLQELFSSEMSAKYIIPLYQREYAWGEAEITQLLNDFYEAFSNFPRRSYHIGIVVIIRRSSSYEGELFELIDGQQRFTTLSILYRLLQHERKTVERKVFFENRPEAEIFLNDFFQNIGTVNLNPWAFRNAMEAIRNFHYNNKDWNTLLCEEKKLNDEDNFSFRNFILNQVKLFIVEMPQSTDVSRYFEIMNNRGRQLEPHELLKAQLLEKFRDEHKCPDKNDSDALSIRFDDLWTVLSHMDGHAEKYLADLTDLADNSEFLLDLNDDQFRKSWGNLRRTINSGQRDLSTPEDLQSVVNDFPNFLMHVLKLYCRKKQYSDAEEIPLDDRQFKPTFDAILKREGFSATEFIVYILKIRLKYDRYVIKSEIRNGEVKAWRLQRCQSAPSAALQGEEENDCPLQENQTEASSEQPPEEENNKLPRTKNFQFRKLVNTYQSHSEEIVKLQSMLQVTYRSRRYKEWLQELLRKPEEELSSPEKMLSFLTKYARGRLQNLRDSLDSPEELYALGLKTPHFLFNLIDYLMWAEEQENTRPDFIFTYRSSIEHHQPQDDTYSQNKDAEWNNSLGNLCLVYSNENSSMSNHSPEEKFNQYESRWKNFPPKRRRMYELTRDRGWNEETCRIHTEQIKKLLENFMNPPKKTNV